MKAYCVLFVFLLAGCDHAKAAVGAAPDPVVAAAAQPAASCVPFDAELSVDGHLAKPTVFASRRPINAYEIENVEMAGATGLRFSTRSTLSAGKYRVRVKVGDCWSRWQDVSLTANPNASGEASSPVPPSERYSDTQCTKAKDYGVGSFEVLTFKPGAPAGSYAVTVTTYEINHAPGYQPLQIEIAAVGGHETEDIEDLEIWHTSQPWTLTGPVSTLPVEGRSGSLHGPSSAVCVTVASI